MQAGDRRRIASAEAARTAPSIGLPYVAYELGFCDEIADEAERRRVDLRCGPPGIRAYAPHLTWLPYTLACGHDPIAAQWAREMGGWRGHGGAALSAATRSARVAATRKFYSWAARKQIACCHPMDGLRNRHLGIVDSEPRDGRALDLEQLARVQVAADQYRGQGPWYQRRASALVSVLRDTGMRVGELRALDVRDFVRRTLSSPPTLMIRDAKGGVVRGGCSSSTTAAAEETSCAAGTA